ncbi:hypothetical protein PENSPDRAFT_65788 [Peniophora sp. CONT]|nr:hypothetical protein PENSPDRAFT_65788 [Peniophora sp. CONT]
MLAWPYKCLPTLKLETPSWPRSLSIAACNMHTGMRKIAKSPRLFASMPTLAALRSRHGLCGMLPVVPVGSTSSRLPIWQRPFSRPWQTVVLFFPARWNRPTQTNTRSPGLAPRCWRSSFTGSSRPGIGQTCYVLVDLAFYILAAYARVRICSPGAIITSTWPELV